MAAASSSSRSTASKWRPGSNIHVGRIEGSLFGQLTLRDLTLSDPKGRFFAAPEAKMDWRPLAYFSNHVDIRSDRHPAARLWRLPALRPGDPNAPLLPDINLDIGRLKVDRLVVDPAVTGYRHLLSPRRQGEDRQPPRPARPQRRRDRRAGPSGRRQARPPPRRRARAEQARHGAQARARRRAASSPASPASPSRSRRASTAAAAGRTGTAARSRLLGGKAFANLGVNAKNGTFTVVGPANPGLMMAEGHGQAPAPADGAGQPRHHPLPAPRRHAPALSSQAIAVGAEGLVDLGRSQFSNLKLAVRLPHPRRCCPISRRATCSSRRCSTARSGRRSSPTTFAPTHRLQRHDGRGPAARGRATVEHRPDHCPGRRPRRADHRPRSVVRRLLTNVSANGTISVSGTTLLSDDLRIRSDRLNATTVIVADLARGRYRAGIQGTVNGYEMEGIGLMDLTTHMDVVTAAGGFGLKGRVAVKTRRIDNASARDLLGGNATATANVVMNPAA
jgi:translocation and assembly module TamB